MPAKYPPARNSGLPENTTNIPRKHQTKSPQVPKMPQRCWGIFLVFSGCFFYRTEKPRIPENRRKRGKKNRNPSFCLFFSIFLIFCLFFSYFRDFGVFLFCSWPTRSQVWEVFFQYFLWKFQVRSSRASLIMTRRRAPPTVLHVRAPHM